MFINYYQTYIRTIWASIGSRMFQEFWISRDGKDIDILHSGTVSCAYLVSNILKQFGLCSAGFANVDKLVQDISHRGWKLLDSKTKPEDIDIGSIIVRSGRHGNTYSRMHKHIGRYMGDQQAISNNSNGYSYGGVSDHVPVVHHWTYDDSREIEAIYTRDRSKRDIVNYHSQPLYHFDLDINHIMSIGEDYLSDKHGLNDIQIDFRLGKSDRLKYGRLCGLACIMSAIAYWSKSMIKYIDTIKYADMVHIYKDIYGHQVKRSAFEKTSGRSHTALIQIAQDLGLDHKLDIGGYIDHIDIDYVSWHQVLSQGYNIDMLYKLIAIRKMLYQHIVAGDICICSVDLHRSSEDINKHGGHLVIISGIDWNGNQLRLVINDPLEKNTYMIDLVTFVIHRSGNMIILTKK